MADPIAGLVQEQFLEVIDRDEAERRFHAVLDLQPLGVEEVPLVEAHGRVLGQDIAAPVDVPAFDRSNVDGFAVLARDTYGATEQRPVVLDVVPETALPGRVPAQSVAPGWAMPIATGGMMPRGADAVVLIEDTEPVASGERPRIVVRRAVTPGANVTFAGTDIGRGETVLRRGDILSARETAVLAALGLDRVPVFIRPRVAILSTGDELLAPGQPWRQGMLYDSNATMLMDAVREWGGQPEFFGIVPDAVEALRHRLRLGLQCDMVLLSGGTSKGAGDLAYRAVAELGPPGIVVHGVALKPGKPVCLAAVAVHGSSAPGYHSQPRQRIVPVVVLPGFPTSALFTFYEFVVPVLCRLGGRRRVPAAQIQARLPMRVHSERGRTEYVLVGLVRDEAGDYAAYPMGKGSGSVTTFSRADGFITIPRQQEYLEAGTPVTVRLLGRDIVPADLVVMGSHCLGLDYLLSCLQQQGWQCKSLAVGSLGGLLAVERGECDLAGIHLYDPHSGQYNRPFLKEGMVLVPGYGRLQGIVYRPGDQRFAGKTVHEAIAAALQDPDCIMVNRNRGSGTRMLIDDLLRGEKPRGHSIEARSHHAVAAAVAGGRADWGVCIAPVARAAGLAFIPLQEERYDFVVRASRWHRPPVQAFCQLVHDSEVQRVLRELGFAIA